MSQSQENQPHPHQPQEDQDHKPGPGPETDPDHQAARPVMLIQTNLHIQPHDVGMAAFILNQSRPLLELARTKPEERDAARAIIGEDEYQYLAGWLYALFREERPAAHWRAMLHRALMTWPDLLDLYSFLMDLLTAGSKAEAVAEAEQILKQARPPSI